jgi:glucose/mannose-6-phosphate isomerase
MSELENDSFFKLDSKKMIDQIENFSHDCNNAWLQASNLTLPSYFIKPKKILMLGMGGSGIANDLIAGLMFDSDLMIDSIHGYQIPSYVDKNTLVVATSYSGNTEEVLAGFISAYKRGAKLIAITTGGKLKNLAEKYRVPAFIFSYPSTPRMSLPFTLMCLVSIFNKLGHLDLEIDLDQILEQTDRITQNYRHEVPISQNLCKSLAQKLFGKVPLIYSSFNLRAIGYRFKCQINENSKTFSYNEYFPELNHNSIQGYKFPKFPVYFIFLESVFDDSQNVKRQDLTAELLQKFRLPYERIRFSQISNLLTEYLVYIQFANYLSYYLAILNSVDPTEMPDIVLFKTKL